MKEIILTDLGDGIELMDDDLGALQITLQAIQDMFGQLSAAFIVSGCVVSGVAPNNNVSAGVVFIDGKLRSLPAQTGLNLGSTRFIVADTDVDEIDRALFLGGTQKRFSAKRAKIQDNPPGGGLQSIGISTTTEGTKLFEGLVYKKSTLDSLLNADWVSAGINGNFSSLPTQDIDFEVKKKDGIVFFRGGIINSSGNQLASGTTAFTLPVGYRPSGARQFNLITENGTKFANIVIGSNGVGVINFYNAGGGQSVVIDPNYTFSFEGCHFSL
jgi:hypothetical protein